MKNLILILSIMWFGKSFAGDFQNGLQALHEKQYSKAIGYFTLVTEQEPTNISAWNNLGISYFKLRKYGFAIHAFQRVAKLDPSDSRTMENIDRCYHKLESNARIDETYSTTQKVAYQIGGFKLNILAFVFSSMLAFMIYKLLKRNQSYKNIYLIVSIPTLLLFLTSIYLSVQASVYLNSVKNAVVVQPKAMLYVNELGKLSDEVLQEGSSVEIIDTKDGFYEIKGSVGQKLFLRQVDCKVF